MLFTLFAVALLVVQVICFILPIIDKRTDDYVKPLKHSQGDKVVIGFSIIGLALSIILLLIAQDADELKTEQAKTYQKTLEKALAERDSIHNLADEAQTKLFIESLDSSYAKSISASNEALAKYNLRLVDSFTVVTNRINVRSANLPQLSLPPFTAGELPSMYLDSSKSLAVRFTSSNNISHNILIRYCVLEFRRAGTGMQYSLIDSGYNFFQKNTLLENVVSTSRFHTNSETRVLKNAIVLLIGQFAADTENKSVIKFEEGYTFDFVNNRMGSSIDAKSSRGIHAELKTLGILK